MKKTMNLALLGLLLMVGLTNSYAQGDSAEVAEEPKDTISIDNMDPVYYEEEEDESAGSSNTTTYAIIGGIVIIAGAAFFFMKKKK